MKKYTKKETGILSLHDLNTMSGKAIYWTFIAILIIISIVSIVPAIWSISQGFKDTQEIYASFSFFPNDMSIDKMVSRLSESWKRLQFSGFFVNTIILSIGELAFSLIVCGFGGYALSKMKPKGSKLVFMLVVWTMMMPSQLSLVPNFISWLHFPFASDSKFGVSLMDTYWPMWFSAGADTFAVLLFKNAFDGVSNSYIEAAKLDGCSDYGVFFKIMFPLVSPIIIYQSINVLSGSWSNFFVPTLVLDRNKVVPSVLYGLRGALNVKMNDAFMGLTFGSIPPFILFLIFHKRIIGGVNIGGVKG